MLGSMNKKARIIKLVQGKDSEGFATEVEETIAEIRCYKEGRHGSESWANLAAFSEATDLFRFRRIPNVRVTEDFLIIYENERYEILSVEDIRGRGL